MHVLSRSIPPLMYLCDDSSLSAIQVMLCFSDHWLTKLAMNTWPAPSQSTFRASFSLPTRLKYI
jgi:hypothetical protein